MDTNIPVTHIKFYINSTTRIYMYTGDVYVYLTKKLYAVLNKMYET